MGRRRREERPTEFEDVWQLSSSLFHIPPHSFDMVFGEVPSREERQREDDQYYAWVAEELNKKIVEAKIESLKLIAPAAEEALSKAFADPTYDQFEDSCFLSLRYAAISTLELRKDYFDSFAEMLNASPQQAAFAVSALTSLLMDPNSGPRLGDRRETALVTTALSSVKFYGEWPDWCKETFDRLRGYAETRSNSSI